MGLSLDRRGMPKGGDFPNREMDVAHVGSQRTKGQNVSRWMIWNSV